MSKKGFTFKASGDHLCYDIKIHLEEDSSLEEDDVIIQLRENMEKLSDLLEVKKKSELEEDDLTLDIDYEEKKILH